jgi:hypothetical protein
MFNREWYQSALNVELAQPTIFMFCHRDVSVKSGIVQSMANVFLSVLCPIGTDLYIVHG